MGESVNATEWPRSPGLGHVCLSLLGVTPSLAKQVGLGLRAALSAGSVAGSFIFA